LTPDRLIDGIWGDDPPEKARHTLQAYVSELRGILDDSIEWTGHGYQLILESGQVDSVEFEQLLERARAVVVDDAHRAAEMLELGLGLWRGEPFADLRDAIVLQPEIQRLQQLRLAAIEARINADLALGRHQQLVEELDTLTREFPYREMFRAQHMLALYRCGRQAEALRALTRTRTLLREELGIDPSPDLQTLEEQILRHDPALDVLPPPASTSPGVSTGGLDNSATVGRAIRGLELRGVIGSGSRSVVYRAYQPSVGREVALKVIQAERSGQADFIRRFEPESQAVASLDHPHILPLYDFWRDPNGAYQVSPLAMGGNLAQRLAGQTWSLASRLRVIDQVGSALAYAHRHHVTHGAVSPANVLFDEDNNAYLTDFAMASPPASRANPDRSSDEPMSSADDIYAFGQLVQRLIGESVTKDVVVTSTAPIRDLEPRDLERVLQRATAAKPDQRYQRVEDLLRDLRQVFGADVVAVASQTAEAPSEIRNPYKGLRAFQESEAEEFFGRDDLTARLIESLRQNRLVAVVGPSGSGKSSLVRAGLIPALRSGALPGSDDWLMTAMFPGAHPFEELATALSSVVVGQTSGMLDDLMSDERGLLRVIKQALPGDEPHLLLLVDQFEELFSIVDDPEVRRMFLESLTEVAKDPDSRVHVVITLRADYFDHPLELQDFGSLVEAGLVPVTVPSEGGLALAISQPARMAGLEFEKGLVGRIVEDVKNEPGGLPLMQHALTELADRHRGQLLTFEAYQKMGGVTRALGNRAEEQFQALTAKEREAAESVLLRLVTVDESAENSRRRVRRSELAALDIDPITVDNVIQRFGAYRLLSFDHDPVTRTATVEVAHEALLREWKRLRDWIEARREDLLLHRRLDAAVKEWQESDQDEELLARGGRLEQFESWSGATTLPLTREEHKFLDASRIHEDQSQRRLRRRRLSLVSVLAVLTAAATSLAIVSVNQAGVAQTRALIAGAKSNQGSDPELALLLAIEALESAPRGAVMDDATAALHEVLLSAPVPRSFPGTEDIAWNPSTNIFATIEDNTRTSVLIRDGTSEDAITTITPGHGPINGMAWSNDGELLALTHQEGPAVIWDLATQRFLSEIPPDRAGYSFPSFGANDGLLAISDLDAQPFCCRSDSVLIWDVEDNTEVRRLTLDTNVFGTHMSPVEPLLLVAEPETFRASVWNVMTGKKVIDFGDLGHHNDFVRFSPDGQRAAVLGPEQLKIWNVASEEMIADISAGTGNVDLEFSPDGELIAISGDDAVVRIFHVESATQVRLLYGATAAIHDVEFGPEGNTLAALWSEVRIWDLGRSGGLEVASYSPGRSISNATWTPDRDRVVTIGAEGDSKVVDVIDAGTGELLASVHQPVPEAPPPGPLPPPDKVVVSPDGRFIAATQHARSTQIIDAATFEIVAVLQPGGSPGSFSPDSGLLIVGDSQAAYIYETRSWAHLGTIRNRDPSPFFTWYFDVAFHPLQPVVFVVDGNETDRSLTVWDIDGELEKIATLPFEGGTHAVSLSATGGRVAVHNVASGAVRVWDVDRALSAADPSSAILLDIDAGDFVVGAVLDGDGRRLVTADGASSELAIWDVDAGRRIYTVDIGAAPLHEPQFSLEGDRLLVPVEGGIVHELSLDINELVEIARARAPRSLTEHECRVYLGGECPTGS
jgi:WD40 repeat protein/serine/threonine protein kinase/DNA-binding SARP family transcriptional activator